MIKLVRKVDNKVKENCKSRDIHPTDYAPVIMSREDGLNLDYLRWGYPGIENKGVIINARAEAVLEKKMFHNGIYNNRIVIPATCFYEWNENKEMSTFLRNDGKPLYFAGFADRDEEGFRYVIITTAANDSMIKVHNRMPLILEETQIEDWILRQNRVKELLCQIPILLQRRTDYEQMSLF